MLFLLLGEAASKMPFLRRTMPQHPDRQRHRTGDCGESSGSMPAYRTRLLLGGTGGEPDGALGYARGWPLRVLPVKPTARHCKHMAVVGFMKCAM